MKIRTKEYIAAGLKILLGLCYIFPLIIAFLFSIQPNEEVGMAPLRFISENPTIQNYFSVWASTPIMTSLPQMRRIRQMQILYLSLRSFIATASRRRLTELR